MSKSIFIFLLIFISAVQLFSDDTLTLQNGIDGYLGNHCAHFEKDSITWTSVNGSYFLISDAFLNNPT